MPVSLINRESETSLSRGEAERVIDERLGALGHAHGYLSAAAREELVDGSNGSAQALRRALSAALFLAATEELTLIAAGDVRRATLGYGQRSADAAAELAATRQDNRPEPAASQREDIAEAKTATGPLTGVELGGRRAARLALPAMLCVLAFGATVVLAPGFRGLVRHAATPAVNGRAGEAQPPASDPIVQRDLPPTRTSPAEVPPLAIDTPAETVLPPALADLPGDPPGRITLLIPPHAARPVARQAASIRVHLEAAGLDVLAAERPAASRSCQGICYYYREDAALAARVANLAGAANNPAIPQNILRTTLFIQPSASPVQRPGSVTLSVP